MTTILLIRHAENDMIKKGRLACRLPGVHLNEEGRANADALAEGLAKSFNKQEELLVKGLFTSPMERAIETAEPLSQRMGIPLTIRPGLLETDCGKWAGRTLKSLERLKSWKKIQESPSTFRFPDGESFAEIQQRMVTEIDSLRKEFNDEKDIVPCFSHADPIKLVIAFYLNMPLDDFQRLVIMPASVTVLRFNDQSKPFLMSLNQRYQKDPTG